MELWWHRARVTAVTPCLHGLVGANLSDTLGPRYLAELVEARFSSSCSLSLLLSQRFPMALDVEQSRFLSFG